MKETLDYQPPPFRRRRFKFNPQFAAGFGAGLLVGIVASTLLMAIVIIIIRKVSGE